MNNGTLYTLNQTFDEDLYTMVLNAIDEQVEGGARFIWQDNNGFRVLDRDNQADMELIRHRLWTRFVAVRVTWSKNKRHQQLQDAITQAEAQRLVHAAHSSSTNAQSQSSSLNTRNQSSTSISRSQISSSSSLISRLTSSSTGTKGKRKVGRPPNKTPKSSQPAKRGRPRTRPLDDSPKRQRGRPPNNKLSSTNVSSSPNKKTAKKKSSKKGNNNSKKSSQILLNSSDDDSSNSSVGSSYRKAPRRSTRNKGIPKQKVSYGLSDDSASSKDNEEDNSSTEKDSNNADNELVCDDDAATDIDLSSTEVSPISTLENLQKSSKIVDVGKKSKKLISKSKNHSSDEESNAFLNDVATEYSTVSNPGNLEKSSKIVVVVKKSRKVTSKSNNHSSDEESNASRKVVDVDSSTHENEVFTISDAFDIQEYGDFHPSFPDDDSLNLNQNHPQKSSKSDLSSIKSKLSSSKLKEKSNVNESHVTVNDGTCDSSSNVYEELSTSVAVEDTDVALVDMSTGDNSSGTIPISSVSTKNVHDGTIDSMVHPLDTFVRYDLITDKATIMRDFNIEVYDTPGDGNCAIQALMHHLNVERCMNVDIYDLENVALFRRYLCFGVMEMFLDESISHPDGDKSILLISIQEESNLLFCGLYSLENHEEYKFDGRLREKFWFDHQNLLPLIGYVLKKSICFFTRNHKQEDKTLSLLEEYVSFIYYDNEKPKEMCKFRQYYESNPIINGNNERIFDVHQFPHTIFLDYDYNQHYDICVGKDSRFHKPEYHSTQIRKTRSQPSLEYTSFAETGYFISEDDFNSTYNKFIELLDEQE